MMQFFDGEIYDLHAGLRQLNSGEIYSKVGRADYRNDFSNTLWHCLKLYIHVPTMFL